MEVHVEDITDDYGIHGVAVYSLVQGMKAYRGEVRADGIDIFERENYKDGKAMRKNDAKQNELEKALTDYIIKENSNDNKN